MGLELPVISRRDLLTHAALGAAAASLIAQNAVSAATQPERKHHWGMVIDTRRCVGCEACSKICPKDCYTHAGMSAG